MSRTFRRTDKYATRYILKEAHSYYYAHNCHYWKRVELAGTPKYPGKEAEQYIARMHGDHGYSITYNGKDTCKWQRSNTQRTYRSQAKTELTKYKRNPEYEVIIPGKKLLPWD